MIRDKLLGKKTLDIDLAADGNVKTLGERLARELDTQFTYHPPFQTGTLQGQKGTRIDLARTRRETYPKPGELPRISASSIEEDLFRRDFTVNAMAQSLAPGDFGKVLDPLKGTEDLKKGLLRVLHDKSFIDDPTRIFRAVRYAQRLGFRIQTHTSRLMKDAVAGIPALSGERLLYELRCIMKEAKDVRLKIIRKLEQLGALGFLGEKLSPISYVRFERIRTEERCEFMCLLFSHFQERCVARLPASKACTKTIDTIRRKKEIFAGLARLSVPSEITFYLKGFDDRGLRVLSETETNRNSTAITAYLDRYSQMKLIITGDDLKAMEIPEGPRYRELMDRVLAARIDGEVFTRRDEKALLKRLIAEG